MRTALLLAFSFWWAHTSPATAQTATPLLTHAVRSINPTDTDFRDLEFLTQEIGAARVVMLGEPTHGEGNVFEAKIRLLRFLHEKMGFTTVAFESGFYDLHRAQQALEAGKTPQEALGNSVFSIWTFTQEFQGVLPLVGKGKLRVAGFDPQLYGEGYSGDLVEELQQFLAPEKGSSALNYDYLDEVIGFMAERFLFEPTAKLADFEKEMGKATRLAEKAAANPQRRAEAQFWQQCLRSLVAQARDYATHDPTAKDETEFKAIDSNPRDAQMANNLLWYLRAHPTEKVVCWGALPHFANKTTGFADAELQAYRPMGGAVKAALGPDQVYILGTLAGGGSYGAFRAAKVVPVPPTGSLEAELLAQPADYAFVSLKHDAPGRVLTTSAFEYKPVTGPWSEMVDGFLFLRDVTPTHRDSTSKALPEALAATVAPAIASPRRLNPATQPVRPAAVASGALGQNLRGVVLNKKTGQPVAYASVSLPAQGVGTVADGQGRFALATRGTQGQVQISSVGYATANVTLPVAAALLTIRLTPAAYELQDVQVRGETLDPRKIMKKVLAAIATNYEQGDYAAEVYTRRYLTNFDTVYTQAEYVSQVFTPAGQRNLHGGFLMLEPLQQHQVQEAHVEKKVTQGLGMADMNGYGQGFYTGGADPVRTSPLFKPSTWRKYTLHLDSVMERDGETVYVIGFVAKKASHRATGTYLQAGYAGRFFVQQRDYAVTHYEALWQGDTARQNAVARKYVNRGNLISRLYSNVYGAERTTHVVDYARAPSGRYQVRRSMGQGLTAGRVLRGGRPFYVQKSCEEYFVPLPTGTTLPPQAAVLAPHLRNGEMGQLAHIEYHPAFWETYQRPVMAPAPDGATPTVKP